MDSESVVRHKNEVREDDTHLEVTETKSLLIFEDRVNRGVRSTDDLCLSSWVSGGCQKWRRIVDD